VAALARARRSRHSATQGRRYSWGYPAVPEQSEHEKVDTALDLSRIGMELSGGYAPVPEQSTLALVAHHPQANYFGMRNGRFIPDGTPDDAVKGSPRDPSLFGVVPEDEDPVEDAVREEPRDAAAAR
jgi:5-methyltetrahydrofolate--homocysteine methyltransferase